MFENILGIVIALKKLKKRMCLQICYRISNFGSKWLKDLLYKRGEYQIVGDLYSLPRPERDLKMKFCEHNGTFFMA